MSDMDALPEIVILMLEEIRLHINNQPELLLETWGAPRSQPGDHCFIDLIGYDDQLIDTIQVPKIGHPFEYLTPIRQRPTIMARRVAPTAPSFRTARYRALSGCGRIEVATHLLPGWRHNPATFNVGLFLARYKRSE